LVKSRPHIILSAAISLDGKIATKNGDSKFSSKLDKIRVHKIRSKVDAILVGKNTLYRDDPVLTVRYSKGKNPIRIILDSSGTISSNSRILKTCHKVPTIIAISKKITKKNLQRLNKFPIDIISSGKKQVNLKQLLKKLVKRKIKKLVVEGGGTVFLVGGKEAISLVQGIGFTNIKKSSKLKLRKALRQKNELVLHYSKL